MSDDDADRADNGSGSFNTLTDVVSRNGDDPGIDDPLLVGSVPARTPVRHRAADYEVPARKNERAVDDSELVWAPSVPANDDPATEAIDSIDLPEAPESPEALLAPAPSPAPDIEIGEPILVVPAVVPAYTPAPQAPVPIAPVVAVPLPVTGPKLRRKDQPKIVKLPRRPRVRKVSRVVRSIDAWTVFKVSAVFYLAMYVVFLVAGVLLWNVAYSTGTIDNISNFFESFGWESFEFNGGEIYHNAWIIGLFVVAGLTGLNVVLATLYNLITDLVGGVRLTILEEEVVVRPSTVPGTRNPSTATVKVTRKQQRKIRRQVQRERDAAEDAADEAVVAG